MTALILLAVLCAASPAPGVEAELAAAWKLFDAREKGTLDAFEAAAARHPGDLRAHMALATAAGDWGNQAWVRARYLEAFARSPTAVNAFMAVLLDDDRVAADLRLKESLARFPAHEGLLWLDAYRRAQAAAAAGRYDAALSLLDASPGRRVDPAALHAARASILLEAGRLKEAWSEAQRSTALERHDPVPYLLRYLIRMGEGDRQGAARELTAAEALGSLAFVDLFGAHWAANGGFRDTAEEKYRRVLESDEDQAGWRAAVALALEGLGSSDEAERWAVESLRLDSMASWAYPVRVRALLARGRTADAARLVQDALARHPEDLGVLGAAADVESALGHAQGARELLYRILARAPHDLGVKSRLAAMLLYEGRCAEVVDYYLEAQREGRSDVFLDRTGGACQVMAGNVFNGREALFRYLGYDQWDAQAWEWVGDADAALKEYDEAMAAYGRSLGCGPPFNAFLRLLAKIADAAVADARGYGVFPKDRQAIGFHARADRPPPVRAQAFVASVSTFSVRVPWGPTAFQLHDERLAFGEAAWAPDGERVYVAVQEIGDGRSSILRVDLRTGATSYVLREASGLRSFFVADGGRRLVLESWDGGGGVVVETLDLAGGPRRVLHATRQASAVRYDPRTDAVFVFNRESVRVDVRTGARTRLPLMGCTHDLDLAPGGRRVVCVAPGPGGSELALYDFDTSSRTLLGLTGEKVRWSPDGSRFAFLWRGRQLRVYEPRRSLLVAFHPPIEQRLELVSRTVWKAPAWSGDSRLVAYELSGVSAGTVRESGERGRVQVVADLKGNLAWFSPEHHGSLSWSPRLD